MTVVVHGLFRYIKGLHGLTRFPSKVVCVPDFVAAMGLADRPAQAIGLLRNQDQMDVVGHQAIGPYFHARLAGLLGQEIAIDLVVPVLEEDRFTPVPTLGDVMGETGNDHASQARHDGNVSRTIRGV